ncbi:MAG: T9SS type A sorting domain-containing protein [Bacteroidota bacterium]
MKKKLLLLFCVFPFLCLSQQRNAIWCFGDSVGIDWSNPQNPQFFTSAAKTRGTSVSISDSNGNLLFYAYTRATLPGKTGRVFDSSHELMQNGDSIVGGGWYHEMVIVPDPANSAIYYLFSIGVTSQDSGIYYSKIDMSLNSGLGKVILKNVQLFSGYLMTDCLTAIKHGNGRDWWVISRPVGTGSPTGNNIFVKYRIDPFGIYGPFIQTIGYQNNTNLGQLLFNSDGSKCMFTNLNGLIDYFSFDRCTGTLSNHINIRQVSHINPYLQFGGAFSANNSIFYTTTSVPSYALYQYDLTAANIQSSELLIDTLPVAHDSIGPGLLLLAPDNKIYWGHQYYDGTFFFPYPDTTFNQYNMNLSVINFPDSIGASCNFHPFSFFLGGARTYYGLPNNPNYDLGVATGNLCPVGVIEKEKLNTLKAYPNPTTGMVTIRGLNNVSVIIADVSGRIIKITNSREGELNLSDLENGTYIITAIEEQLNLKVTILH